MMKQFILTIILSALLIHFSSCSSNPVPPEIVLEASINRSYIKNVERIFETEFEAELIRKAENVYPDRDSILADISPHWQELIPEERYWFFYSFDGVLIPYAVTIDAIDYYEDLIDSMNTGESMQFIYQAEFNYKAEVVYHETYIFSGIDQVTREELPTVNYENVYVMESSLSWDHYCGPMRALYINHKRLIVFNETGDIIDIFFDGLILIAVS